MTYLPPFNGGRINATISGNTAGAGALMSTGTVTLAGGNNITLSQNGNAITISGGAGGVFSAGMSTGGNTSGTTGLATNQMVFAGGNNITLSQSTAAGGNTLTISAANQTVQTQNLHNITVTGNTAGAMAQISSGTLTLAGGNNITLSQNGNALTVSGANQTAQTQNVHNVTLAGNTAGAMAQVSSGTLTLAGGNNITLSQNGNAVTVSGPSQTVQTQNVQNVVLGGNTAGAMATISSGTLTLAGGSNITLSQNGNAVTISGGAGGGGGIALANNQTTYNTGTVNLVASGALTISSGAGESFNLSVPPTSSLSATGLVSIATNGSTISIGASAPTNSMDFYQNMDRGTSGILNVPYNSLMLQRLNQENDEFAAYITANTMLLNMSGSGSSNSSSAHTISAMVGIYQDNTTGLSLINSASTTWSMAANAGNSLSYLGVRWLSIVSSQWSSAPVFVQGSEYVFGVLFRSGNLSIPLSYIGQMYMASGLRSGTLGAASNNNTTLAHGNYWNAVYNTSTSAFPTVISANQVLRTGTSANFIPHVVLNNRYAGTF